jgi:hypothetical protein
MDSSGPEELRSIKEFSALLLKVVSALVGLAAAFAFVGYTIALSFINSQGLYGLTTFPQEFYKEAILRFLGDLAGTYGGHPFCASLILAVVCGVGGVIVSLNRARGFSAGRLLAFVLHLGALLGTCLLILLTLRLDLAPEGLFGVLDVRKLILFMVCLPTLIVLLILLAVDFGYFQRTNYAFYYVKFLLFACLFLAIPIGYGNNIFDITVFHVSGLGITDSPKVESLQALEKDVAEQGEGKLYFLMGHTSDREVFFASQLWAPARMILVEKSLIKVLKISKDGGPGQTLRSILKVQAPIRPISQGPAAGLNVEPLPQEIQNAIDKASPGDVHGPDKDQN